MTAAVAVVTATLAAPAGAEDGAVLYRKRCAFCHGETGRGDGPAASAVYPPVPDFTAPGFWRGRTRSGLRKALAEGRHGKSRGPLGEGLSPSELDALADHLWRFRPGMR